MGDCYFIRIQKLLKTAQIERRYSDEKQIEVVTKLETIAKCDNETKRNEGNETRRTPEQRVECAETKCCLNQRMINQSLMQLA